MRLTIIDRYILREILLACGAVFAILLIILVTNTLIYMLGQVVEGRVAGDVVLPLLLANLGQVAVNLIPPGLFIGILLTFGRLYADSEMAALQACGWGPARLYRPVLLAALPLALVAGVLSVMLAPWAERMDHEITQRAEARSDLAGVAAGQFTHAGQGNVVLFAASRADDGTLADVFVEATNNRGERVVVHADEAVERRDSDTGLRYIEFRDGTRHEGNPGSAEFRVIDFERHGVLLPQRENIGGEPDREARSLAQLWAAGSPEDVAEIHWRLGFPLGCLTLALAALPLARTTPRRGRYSRIAPALLLYVLYANFMVMAREAVADGQVPPVVGMWWAHALVLALIGGLLVYQNGWRWTRELIRPYTGRGA